MVRVPGRAEGESEVQGHRSHALGMQLGGAAARVSVV